jgi:hypothetical protein
LLNSKQTVVLLFFHLLVVEKDQAAAKPQGLDFTLVWVANQMQHRAALIYAVASLEIVLLFVCL